MKYKIAPFSHIWKLSDLFHVTSWRKLGAFEKSSDCHQPRDVSETCPSSEDICHEPCPPCTPPREMPPCPCPKPPPYAYSKSPDPRKRMIYRMLSIFVALPVIVIMSMITYTRVQQEEKKPRPPFQNLPYMYRRTKPFPWGDGNHTLFHNPIKNPVPPHGYEVEDPNAIYVKKKNSANFTN